eukprot:Plantae.Rhodophyta-Purpureofilum_apyrenoidigerum.ctg15388.p1 GENE.Plantae.Rhodophyta-Purpureofilum_apyrenoidigerum.ctg15388~~Plantae.Rhodophyta-Purpureofilum_apyrenoidigerum.ctg15388.p1  ORF type:complete len:201 (-),score=34.05 Plantae.Rhodophyta-Purpureofilum_apyrenoidigerum.ctg15388:98-700(-)
MSAYVIGSGPDDSLLRDLFPKTYPLKQGWGSCLISVLERDDEDAIGRVHETMNWEVKRGTYPQNKQMNRSDFLAYYVSHTVLVARCGSDVVGSMYIKPNFPGRCSHICNGGLLVMDEWRGRGVGRAIATAFEEAAPRLGYYAAFFNLVFFDNPASLSLWQSMGYVQVGRVPKAKLTSADAYTDAAMFYKNFSGSSPADKS